jgi:hypothetical protein
VNPLWSDTGRQSDAKIWATCVQSRPLALLQVQNPSGIAEGLAEFFARHPISG